MQVAAVTLRATLGLNSPQRYGRQVQKSLPEQVLASIMDLTAWFQISMFQRVLYVYQEHRSQNPLGWLCSKTLQGWKPPPQPEQASGYEQSVWHLLEQCSQLLLRPRWWWLRRRGWWSVHPALERKAVATSKRHCLGDCIVHVHFAFWARMLGQCLLTCFELFVQVWSAGTLRSTSCSSQWCWGLCPAYEYVYIYIIVIYI